MTHLATHLLTCIPIKSTSQDSSSSLDALLCRVLWTLYGFSLKFISFSCNFYLQFVDPFVHFVPEVMLAKANARFVAHIFCTWRPEAKFQWKLVPAYQILAKELDDVIVHCQIPFGQGFEWQGHWACKSFCQVILQETCDSPETPRKGFAGRSVFLSNMLVVGWTFQKSNVLAEVFHVHVLLAFHCHHGSGSLVSFGKVGRFLEGSCIRVHLWIPSWQQRFHSKGVFWERKIPDKVWGGRFRKILDKVKQNPSMNFVFNIERIKRNAWKLETYDLPYIWTTRSVWIWWAFVSQVAHHRPLRVAFDHFYIGILEQRRVSKREIWSCLDIPKSM